MPSIEMVVDLADIANSLTLMRFGSCVRVRVVANTIHTSWKRINKALILGKFCVKRRIVPNWMLHDCECRWWTRYDTTSTEMYLDSNFIRYLIFRLCSNNAFLCLFISVIFLSKMWSWPLSTHRYSTLLTLV